MFPAVYWQFPEVLVNISLERWLKQMVFFFYVQERHCISFSVLTSAALLFPVSKIWSQRQGNLNPFSLGLYWGMWITHVPKCYKTKHSEKKIHEGSGAKLFTSCKFSGAEQPGTAPCHRAVPQRKPVQSHFSGLLDLEATLDERGSGRWQFSYFCSVLM